jgi:TolA-binding protein
MIFLLLLAATPAHDAFYAATDLARTGRNDAAAAAYEEVARKWPDDDIADDALAEAAQIREEKLGDPEGALRVWSELLQKYPQSRLARRAQLRADYLRGALAGGAEPLRIYQEVLAQYPKRPHAESIARMSDLVARFPNFPLAPNAWFWLGEAHAQEKQWDEALRAYEHVRATFPNTEWAARAEKAIGDTWLERGDIGRAVASYDELAKRGGPWSQAAELGRSMARREKIRRAAFWSSIAWLIIFVAAYGFRARSGLVFPLELKYYLPVAIAFVAAAYTEHKSIFRATLMLAAAGAVITGLVGQRPVPRGRRVFHALAICGAVAATFFLAIHTQHLTDMVMETLHSGAER